MSKQLRDMTDRDLLLEIYSKCAVLEERSKAIPVVKQEIDYLMAQDSKHTNDIRWIKRLMFGGVPGASVITVIILKLVEMVVAS